MLSGAPKLRLTPGGDPIDSGRGPDRLLIRISAYVPGPPSCQYSPKMGEQDIVADRFGQIGSSAASKGASAGYRAGIGGHENHRQPGVGHAQSLLQLQAAHSRHSHVRDDAVERPCPILHQQSLSSIELATPEVHHSQQIA